MSWVPAGPDPAMVAALDSLSQQLSAAVAELKSGAAPKAGGGWGSDPRATILKLGGQIVAAAKLPHEQWVDQCMMQGQLGALRVFVDWGVFDKIPLQGDEGITYKDLAEKVDAEEAIVRECGPVEGLTTTRLGKSFV